MKIEVLHYLPGRIRLRVPGLKKNMIVSQRIENILLTLPGINNIRVNHFTGSVLVYYKYSKVHHEIIIQSISEAKKDQLCRRKTQMQTIITDWHVKNCKDVLGDLQSDPFSGLTVQERNTRLIKYGYNEFGVKKNLSLLSLMTDPFREFMGQLLLGIGLVSLLTRQYYDAIAIVAIIGLEAGMGVIQGLRAEKSMGALKKLATPYAKVLVEGDITKIPSIKLVPGDIILVNEGDIIPADCRLIDVLNLVLDESNLTGESMAVDKKVMECTQLELPLAERINIIYMSTRVTKGSARAIVIATGVTTEIGRLAKALDKTGVTLTPLQQQLEELGKKLAIGSLLLCGGVIGIGLLKGRPFMEMVRTGLTLAVGVIPEGLPTIAAISLAFGAKKMTKKNAIVRNLSAVETLGNATVICTDKTGTLTKGEMTVTKLYADGSIWDATDILDPEKDKRLSRILLSTALCNNAQIRSVRVEEPDVSGDPTEVALMSFAIKGGVPWAEIKDIYCRQKEIAFDSERKMMTVVCTDPEGSVSVYAKGAIDNIIAKCERAYKDDKIVTLDTEMREEVFRHNGLLAGKALRILALAYRPLEEVELLDEEIEKDLIFLGLVGLADPPKAGVLEAVEKCHQSGIKVVMITGDHPITAQAVGRDVGLLQKGDLITGNEIDKMNDKELLDVVPKVEIYSRATPQHKLRIVKAFKELGYIVAMTGDGVNDAPAVREAHVGIAMGQKGTDVTREAAAITLADDNFTTIVNAIEEGKNIRGNIKKSLQYVLSGNFGEVVAFILAVSTGMALPLVPSQIILVNFITESIPVIALGAGNGKVGRLMETEKNPSKNLISKEMANQIGMSSLLAGLTTYGLFAGTLALGGGLFRARTMALSNLILSQMFNFLDCKPATRYKLPSAGVSIGFLLASIYTPVLSNVFQTTPLRLKDWGLVMAISGLSGRVKL